MNAARRRELMLQCVKENATRGVKFYSLLDGRLLRYDAETIGELETLGGCHGISPGSSNCGCGWSLEKPVIRDKDYHPAVELRSVVNEPITV